MSRISEIKQEIEDYEYLINDATVPQDEKDFAKDEIKELKEELAKLEAKATSSEPKKKTEPKAPKPKSEPKEKAEPKSKAEPKGKGDDDYCNELITKEKERKAKAKANAQKRANAPKKSPSTKNREAVGKTNERVTKSVVTRAKKGEVKVEELEKLIAEYEEAIKKLKDLLSKVKAGKKFARGGKMGVMDAESSKEYNKIKDHHCGCGSKMAKGGNLDYLQASNLDRKGAESLAGMLKKYNNKVTVKKMDNGLFEVYTSSLSGKAMAQGGNAGEWSVSDIENAKYLGIIEFQDNDEEYHNFEVMDAKDRLVFGSSTNSGFSESGYIEKDGMSTDETLEELLADLEVYYNDGGEYTSMIVFNERMARGGGVKARKSVEIDNKYSALKEGRRVSEKVAYVDIRGGGTYKRRNANQYGKVKGGKVYYEHHENRIDSGRFLKNGGQIGKELMGGQPNQKKPSGAILLEVRNRGKEIIVTEDNGITKEVYVKSNGYAGYTLHYNGNQYEFAHSL